MSHTTDKHVFADVRATFADALPELCAPTTPRRVAHPDLVWTNTAVADDLGLTLHSDDTTARALSGDHLAPGSTPVAMRYAGHQFGQFVPHLNDGRAATLGELPTNDGLRDIAVKGSGLTPVSRGGDGLAAIGPMLREAVISESLAALGVPTTRCLGVVATGGTVWRQQAEPAAVMCRVAAGHIRFGTFQWAAGRRDPDLTARLVRYSLDRWYPDVARPHSIAPGDAAGATLAFLQAVRDRHAALVAAWQGIGFVHGVLNTDNCTVTGEAMDFGPCAFLETYNPHAVFSSIDRHGRYRFDAQPVITQWNLARFAESLLPVLGDDDEAIATAGDLVAGFATAYATAWGEVARRKLGLPADAPIDLAHNLAHRWLGLLHRAEADHTTAWVMLTDAATQDLPRALGLDSAADAWVRDWRAACDGTPNVAAMTVANPRIIARNHTVAAALDAATAGDYGPVRDLLEAVRQPYSAAPEHPRYAEPAPKEFMASYRTYCGT